LILLHPLRIKDVGIKTLSSNLCAVGVLPHVALDVIGAAPLGIPHSASKAPPINIIGKPVVACVDTAVKPEGVNEGTAHVGHLFRDADLVVVEIGEVLRFVLVVVEDLG